MFIESGVLEVYTQFEGNEFIIDTLHSGSVINYRAFLMEDLMYVNIRCKEFCKLLVMNQSLLEDIKNEHDEIKRHLMRFQNKIL